jgi:apolipoprotein N-acyltransferase
MVSLRRSLPKAALCAAAVAVLWIAGRGLQAIEWSSPSGPPLTVSLVQGNIAQERKFEPDYRERTLQIYRELVEKSRGRLIVLPESALPMFADEVPAGYVDELRALARRNGGDLLVGVFFFEPAERQGEEDRYYNSVVSLGSSRSQVYRKYHLVPFGETIPLKPIFGWLIRSVLNIPLADQTPGTEHPVPFEVAGERLAMNICYEDAFGNELIRQLPDATLLMNLTNDAWYGRSFAAQQHSQMGAMRALESARRMLRATNTGITSVIDHRGVEQAALPWFTSGILEATVTGRTGVTPYVRFGDLVAVTACAVLLLALALTRRAGISRV